MSELKAFLFLIKLLKQQLKRGGADLQMGRVESDMGSTSLVARDEAERADEAADTILESLLWSRPSKLMNKERRRQRMNRKFFSN